MPDRPHPTWTSLLALFAATLPPGVYVAAPQFGVAADRKADERPADPRRRGRRPDGGEATPAEQIRTLAGFKVERKSKARGCR
jgi:hypothetical protein